MQRQAFVFQRLATLRPPTLKTPSTTVPTHDNAIPWVGPARRHVHHVFLRSLSPPPLLPLLCCPALPNRDLPPPPNLTCHVMSATQSDPSCFPPPPAPRPPSQRSLDPGTAIADYSSTPRALPDFFHSAAATVAAVDGATVAHLSSWYCGPGVSFPLSVSTGLPLSFRPSV